MPCENCNVQFTFLKRKRNCGECSRFYCAQCLEKRNNLYLCERCVIFTTRPISKVDLLKLKPKDLIFYLQSKHISTAGCVEKEELVNLVLAHVNSDAEQQIPNNDAYSRHDSSGSGSDNNCSNPFDQFKQSCQNFFNNFTGKIASDFNFDTRTASNISNVHVNISDQPRVSTREIPTYASSVNVNVSSSSHQSSSNSVPNINVSRSPSGQGINDSTTNGTGFNKYDKTPTATHAHLTKGGTVNLRDMNSSSSLSSPSSPIISISSLSSQSLSSQYQTGRPIGDQLNVPPSNVSATSADNVSTAAVSPNSRRILDNILDASGSGCECSDDEIITKFQTRNRMPNRPNQRGSKPSPPSQTDSAFEDHIPGPSGSIPESSSSSKSSTGNQKNSEDSSGSSFEELGAVGGGSPSDTEHWQFVNKTETNAFREERTVEGNGNDSPQRNEFSKNETFQITNIPTISDKFINDRKRPPRKMVRRRSDSSIYTQKRIENDIPLFPLVTEESDGDDTKSLHKRQRKSCQKCGKNKKNLEKCVAKFIKQLQCTQMSKEDIRQEADAFLAYLQNRESFDCSDSEYNEVNDRSSNEATSSRTQQNEIYRSNSIIMEAQYGHDDGIHVYAQNAPENARHNSRFLNLWDIKSSSEIDDLSVKQLKEILMLNRVDYKGCCEKQELLERVHRLWNDLKTSPAVDKLDVDDLCKICMDAPIECVMLECGHMATCTSCGKVLSECPICRQYVVRVVRFFKA